MKICALRSGPRCLGFTIPEAAITPLSVSQVQTFGDPPSARTFHKRLSSVYASHPKHSKPPTSLHGQLYWREFYYTCALGTPNYEKMVGNPICRQIDWDDDDEKLAAWKQVLSDRSHTRQ